VSAFDRELALAEGVVAQRDEMITLGQEKDIMAKLKSFGELMAAPDLALSR